MNRRVVWSSDAEIDYLEIIDFIADDNPDAALRVARHIQMTAANLSNFATGRAGRVFGTYEKLVASLPYILVYEIVSLPEAGDLITILHVIHMARDWPADGWPKD